MISNQPLKMNTKIIPNRPFISDLLIRASADILFRMRLLTDIESVLAEVNLPAQDTKILKKIRARSLAEFSYQVEECLVNQNGDR